MNHSTISLKNTAKGRILLTVGVAVFWLSVWQILAMSVSNELLIPGIPAVVEAFLGLCERASFWQSAALSMARVIGGFVAAVVVGTTLSFICRKVTLIDILISPILHIIRTAPVASFIILALVWIKTDILPVFIAFIMVVPISFAGEKAAALSVDKQLVEMGRCYGISGLKLWHRVVLPSALPTFLTSCVTGLGFAWKSAIAAEIICLPQFSIGKQLQNAKVYLETPELFAHTATIVMLSFMLEIVFNFVVKKSSDARLKVRESGND